MLVEDTYTIFDFSDDLKFRLKDGLWFLVPFKLGFWLQQSAERGHEGGHAKGVLNGLDRIMSAHQ